MEDRAAVGLQLPREILVEGIALGVQRALGDVARGEFRAFLEEYFGVLDKSEIAAFLGVSERTVNELWKSGDIPKDTLLGEKMPRSWMPALKEALAGSRRRARAARQAPPVLKAVA